MATIGATASVSVAGCSEAFGTADDGPRAVVEDWLGAIDAGDQGQIDALIHSVSPNPITVDEMFPPTIDSIETSLEQETLSQDEITALGVPPEELEEEDTALVAVEFTAEWSDGETVDDGSEVYFLATEDDEWKVVSLSFGRIPGGLGNG